MAKPLLQFICQSCGSIFPRWQGQCSACGEWNSLTEEVGITPLKKAVQSKVKAVPITNVTPLPEETLSSGYSEVDRLLGRGFVKGSVTLLGGEPGIGKSTLSLQVAQKIAERHKVLYVSSEESVHQLVLRSQRTGLNNENLLVLNETNMLGIIECIRQEKPDFIILDSIQVVAHPEMPSTAGSVNQVRHCAQELINEVKRSNAVGVLIGHITKEGGIAGPKVLEHLVDLILYFEGERNQKYRLLRCFKNRYFNTQEIGIFEMGEGGLKEVLQPNEIFIDAASLSHPGAMVSAVVEGSRAFLVEIQSLAVSSGYGMAKRTFLGVDANRSNLLITAMEKRLDMALMSKDIIINIVGGLKISEPALDLAIVLAIISSVRDIPIGKKIAVFGEVGLTGEVRPVPNAEKRVQELAKMGFEGCILPTKNRLNYTLDGFKLIYVSHITEAIAAFLNQAKS